MGGPGGYLAEVFLDPSLGLGMLEIPGNGERCVVGRVIRAEEILHVIQRRRLEIFMDPNDAVVVRMALGIEVLVEVEPHRSIRLALALTPFVAHHHHLVVELLLRHGRQEPAHAIRIHEESALQLVAKA